MHGNVNGMNDQKSLGAFSTLKGKIDAVNTGSKQTMKKVRYSLYDWITMKTCFHSCLELSLHCALLTQWITHIQQSLIAALSALALSSLLQNGRWCFLMGLFLLVLQAMAKASLLLSLSFLSLLCKMLTWNIIASPRFNTTCRIPETRKHRRKMQSYCCYIILAFLPNCEY